MACLNVAESANVAPAQMVSAKRPFAQTKTASTACSEQDLEQAMQLYGDLVASVCRRIAGNADIDDVWQRVFIAYWQKSHLIQGSHAAWLQGCAVNLTKKWTSARACGAGTMKIIPSNNAVCRATMKTARRLSLDVKYIMCSMNACWIWITRARICLLNII